MSELADEADSKSVDGNIVWVQVPLRPFCSERCKLIDLGQWASGSYVIHGQPGSADPDLIVEQLERMQREKEEEEREGKCK